jgi:hypothetical protein
VVIGVISCLISVLMPALSEARGSARRVTCQNHLRQIALAMTLHTDQHRRFPAAGHFSARGKDQFHSWVTTLLPYLEQQTIASRYDLNETWDSATNRELTATSIPVLTCPDDVSLSAGQGNLSYVVNGGLAWTIPVDCPARLHATSDAVTISPLDFNGDGSVCSVVLEKRAAQAGSPRSDLEYFQRTSLFFVENWPAGTGTQRFHRPQEISDGLTQTILMSENVRAGYDPSTPSGWGAPDPLRCMFFVSSYVCRDAADLPEDSSPDETPRIRPELANARSLPDCAQESLNAALHQAEGTAPWPSSGHRALVHFAWCDGRVAPLSEEIDGQVYFALTTPQGFPLGEEFGEVFPENF